MDWRNRFPVILLTIASLSVKTAESFTFTKEPSNPTVVAEGTQVSLIWEYVLDPGETIQNVFFRRKKTGETHLVLIAARSASTAFTFTNIDFLNKYRALVPATLVLLDVNKSEEFLYTLTVDCITGDGSSRQVDSEVAIIVSGCDGILNGSSGSFGTPAFPGFYDNNLNCTWTLRIPADGYLRLNFRMFNTEQCCDFVELTDSAGRIMQKHSGLKSAFAVTLLGRATLMVKVRFRSDSSVRRPGFLADYVIISAPHTMPVPSLPSITPATALPTSSFAPLTTTALSITPSTSVLAPVSTASVMVPNAVIIPPELQRLFSNLLQSLTQIIDQIGILFRRPISAGDVGNFRNATLQILQQVQNQLLAATPPNADSRVKRAIQEFPNPWKLRKLIEKMQRRLG